MSRGTATTIAWQADRGDEVTIELEVEGLGVFRSLVCRSADTGSFTIPAEALSAIEGTSTQGLLSITRRNLSSIDSATADAHIELAVGSNVFGTVALTRP